MSGRARVPVLVALVALVSLALAQPQERDGVAMRHAPVAPRATASPPRLSAKEANRQDRVSAAHARREVDDVAERPLIAVLPLKLADVRIDVDGLAPDGRRTRLSIRPDGATRPFAKALYRRVLRAYGDRGDAYEVRWSQPARGPVIPPRANAADRAAETYTLAATNWSADTYAGALRAQAAKATGALRRELLHPVTPLRVQVHQLRQDVTSRLGAVVRSRQLGRRRRVTAVRLRVDQLDSSAGRRVRHAAGYLVRLRLVAGRWRVERFGAVGSGG